MNATKRKRADPEPFRIDLHGAFIRRTDLSQASLVDANLAHTDAAGASFRDADFLGATLNATNLVGADLTGAKNLTIQQLSEAVLDDTTILPDYIDRTELRRAQATKRA